MQSAPIHVLPVGKDHIPVLVELMRQYWEYEQIRGFAAEHAERLLKDFLSHPDFGRSWIAFNDNQVLGYLLCSRVFSFEYGGITAAIDELYVIAEARGQGVGKLLVGMAEQTMRELGCVHIEMEVQHSNFKAQQFYSLLGFASRTGYSLMHKVL